MTPREEPPPASEGEAADPPAGALERLADELRGALAEAVALAASARRVAALEIDRARLRAREAVFGLALLACASVVGVGMLATAGVLLVLGLVELLRVECSLSSWASALLAGLFVAGVPLAAVLLLRRAHLRRLGAELRQKYAKARSERAQAP